MCVRKTCVAPYRVLAALSVRVTHSPGSPNLALVGRVDIVTRAEHSLRRDRRGMGTPLRIEPPPITGATARTAPKDSRAYGRRGSFHLIAACALTAPIFRIGNRRSSLTHEIIFSTPTPCPARAYTATSDRGPCVKAWAVDSIR
jgi:hypothetical protein